MRREISGCMEHPRILSVLGFLSGGGDREPTIIYPWYDNGDVTTYMKRRTLGNQAKLSLVRQFLNFLGERLILPLSWWK